MGFMNIDPLIELLIWSLLVFGVGGWFLGGFVAPTVSEFIVDRLIRRSEQSDA